MLFGSGCGYRALHSQAQPADADRLAVVIVDSRVTPTTAADEVAGGVRESLARSGMLRSGSSYPRAEVEVVRIDQESDAVADTGPVGAPSALRTPRAHGLRVGVVARAAVRRSEAEAPITDTGDVRAFTILAAESDPDLGSELLFERAARAAGRQAGLRLGARLLGHPSVSE